MLWYSGLAVLLIQVLAAALRVVQQLALRRSPEFKGDYSDSRPRAADFVRSVFQDAGRCRPARLALGERNAYDPLRGRLELSSEVYFSNSLSAYAIAAHEAGHAMQETAPSLCSSSALLSEQFKLLGNVLLLLGVCGLPQSNILAGFLLLLVSILLHFPLLLAEWRAFRTAKWLLRSTEIFSERELSQLERSLRGMFMTYLLP